VSARRGVLLFVLLLSVIGTAVLFAALRLRGPLGGASAGTMIVFDLPADLPEGDAPVRALSLGFRRSRYFMHEVVEGLREAAADDDVHGLVMHIEDLDWGWAKAHEVRDALQQFRASGKTVYASLESGGELEYLIASVADVIVMPPAGELQLDGLSASSMFLRGALDKLDVSPNFVQSGPYKSAVEQYTRTSMSPAAREAIDAILDDEYGMLIDSLATARGFTSEDVKDLLDAGPFVAEDARAAGLIDSLIYDAEVDSFALAEFPDNVTTSDFADYIHRHARSRTGQRIALITASGTILPGKSRDVPGEENVMGSETMIEALREARTRGSIKAVVLRIDSPGGSVQASDDIWREVKLLADEKPVIVSMSDLAASGGYYIAAPAHRIVAEPSTLTGSIGVFGGKLNVGGLFNKVGVNIETVTRGTHAGMMSPYRDFTAEELQRYQQQIDAWYRLFLSRVVEGRGMSEAEVDSVAQGRVWTGVDAWERGLVDTLGGLETAIALAREAAGIQGTGPIEVLPRVEHHWYEDVFEAMFDREQSAALPEMMSPVVRAWFTAARLQSGIALALMPFSVEIR
jgi:protease-4